MFLYQAKKYKNIIINELKYIIKNKLNICIYIHLFNYNSRI